MAIGADGTGLLTEALVLELSQRGYEILRHGALVDGSSAWASIGRAVARDVVEARADVGIICCWTGTGICMAANKVRGARAALCADAQTAAGARRWNDANILALSLRATTPVVGLEILEAFLATPMSDQADDCAEIRAIEAPPSVASAVARE